MTPYAGTPPDLEPFGHFAKPYYENYTQPNIYTGAAREVSEPKDIREVRIGFLGPVAKQADQVYGLRMLHGAQMAIDEANARGGYGGRPFRLMVHDDYSNWQFAAEAGEQRPTDAAIWGAPLDEAVKMIYDEGDWAIFGSFSAESTHMVLRLALKAEIPVVNSAATDPTLPETYIPWYFTDLQDDRVQGYTLARHIFGELHLRRAALIRVNNRYGRMGVEKFRDAARRLGHPVVIEQKYLPGQTDFRRELRAIRDSRADAVVIWGDEPEAALILRQMRELGMSQRAFGSARTLGAELVQQAGPAAEGFEAVVPYDPTRSNPLWTSFEQRYTASFGESPEMLASLAYDAMNILLESICRAGLNRARIQDALDQVYAYDGVTGRMVFDPNNKNVSPMFLGAVHDGQIQYHEATMGPASSPARPADVSEKASGDRGTPYARVGEDGVSYAGPPRPAISADDAAVVIFGPGAMRAAKASPRTPWRLVAVESDQNWGVATTQLVQALESGHGLAIVALDRNAAHFAEQMALKFFVPVVALTADRTITSTNVPWIFRLPPDAGAAKALRVLQAAGTGTNPQKLRDVLASGRLLAGVRFQNTGEPALN